MMLLFVFLQTLQIYAQNTNAILERMISANFKNTPLKEALKTVSEKGNFEFSYAGRIIEAEKKTTLIINNLTVRESLALMLGYNYSYQQKGNYLIIKKSEKAKQYISGYISDTKTGKRVQNATVYDAKTLRSTTTDENGFYALKVPQRSTIVVAKLSYNNSLLQVNESTPRFIKMDLDTIAELKKGNEKRNNWGNLPNKLANLFITPLHNFNQLNVKDTIHRVFQLSFVPYIGTNHSMSGNVTNDYSINMIAGYARGNRIAEFSGVGSFINENTSGMQASGVFNIVKGNTKGLQTSGVFNHVNGTLHGVQLGGVWNYAQTTHAVNQSAGVANVSSKGNVKTQFAGVTNIGDTINGDQISGVLNTATFAQGIQVAGVLNQAKRVQGVQVSGVLNQAKYIKGVQIGVLNYADSIEGLQIGLINYAKKGGYNAVELSANEINNANIAYKSGGRKLYTTIIAGITPNSDANIWTHGLGIGTMLKVKNNIDLNFESIYRHVNVGLYSNYLQDWLQLGAYANLNIGKHFALSFGPNVNTLFLDTSKSTSLENIDKVFPSYIKPRVYNTNHTIRNYGWIGGKLALQISL